MASADRFSTLKALQRTACTTVPVPMRARLGGSVAERLGGELCRNEHGEYVKVSRWFTTPGQPASDPIAIRMLWPNATDEAADPQQWLFVDTETTGLAGGTGTYAFLVGIAWWEGSGLQVEQFFMRDLDEEWPVLLELKERLEQRTVIVTYNGKSFDWPLLETRYRLTRTIAIPEIRAHLDCLHPARCVWRARLGSVRLSELEQHVLGWTRTNDVPSELIPRLYLDFLRGGSPEPLLPVLAHNQMDLRGLAAIVNRILELVAAPQTTAEDPLDMFGLSKLYERRGQSPLARDLYERVLSCSLPAEVAGEARSSAARLAKCSGDYRAAAEHWAKSVGVSTRGLEAYEQLAIYYEHRSREPHRAIELVREAISQLRGARAWLRGGTHKYDGAMARLRHRLARLERKTRTPLLEQNHQASVDEL